MSEHSSDHWIHRCLHATKEWLLDNPRSVLSTEAFDAVVGAGGAPVRNQQTGDHYLSDADQEYLIELRRAGAVEDPR